MTSKTVLCLFFSLAVVGMAQAELLPFPGCFMIELAFKALGCAAQESKEEYCQYMALALRLQLETGEPLCEKKPCVGYEQSGKTCTTLFPRSCGSSDRVREGICPLGRECCTED